MPYQPIEDYGIIGNLRTVALVGINGSIDWYCSPNFDSPSVFGAMLDDNKGGRFQIAPIADTVRRKQFYWPSTNILVTRFSHEDGIAELVDFMPVGFAADSPSYHQLHRTVRCVRGTVRLGMVCKPALDYGRASHEVQVRDGVATFNAGSGKDRFSLAANVPLKFQDGGGVSADFVLEEGQTKTFIFQNDDGAGKPAAITNSEDRSARKHSSARSNSGKTGFRAAPTAAAGANASNVLRSRSSCSPTNRPAPSSPRRQRACPKSSAVRAIGIIATLGCATRRSPSTRSSASDSRAKPPAS